MPDEPCTPWATLEDVASCVSCSTEDLSDAALEEGLAVASAWLYRLSGRRYAGACTATVRPIAECGCCGMRGVIGGGPPWGWVIFDVTSGTQCVMRAPTAGIRGRPREGVEEITLGYSPIREVVEVLIDGAVLAPSAYRIDDDAWLVRTDGGTWPHTNRMELATTEPGTWSVEIAYSWDPPRDGRVAARTWGIEVAKSLCGKDCALPARTQQLSRQGVTLTLLDPTDLLTDGRSGIPVVDAFLQSVNPTGLDRPAAIVNVDLMRLGRRTTPFVGS